MAYIPDKVIPIPKLFFNTKCKLYSKTDEINRYGEAETTELVLMCKFKQKTKRILTEDRSIVVIEGTALISGEADLKNIVNGEFKIFDTTYKVYSCKGVRNPDGSIHHWKLELI